MLSVQFLPPNNWILLETVGTEYVLYGAVIQPVHKGMSEFTIYKIADSEVFQPLEISAELYKTTFWSDNPTETAEAILEQFGKSHSKLFPFELAHMYGGTLEGGYQLKLLPQRDMKGVH